MNKKGAEITIGTIVIIILAVIVLVVLVLGFTGGWGNLWDRVEGFFGGGNNIDSVVQQCQVACSTQSQNDFCTRMRTVRADSEIFAVKEDSSDSTKPTDMIIDSGNEFAYKETGQVKLMDEGQATCKDLAVWHSTLGFEGCSDLCD